MNRAVQVEFLLAGIEVSGAALALGKVYTYEAGSTTAKDTWLDADKEDLAANPILLDENGRANVWADGPYKFTITDANDVPIPNGTLDGLKYRSHSTSVVTKIADYVATTDDDVILVDAEIADVTITLPPVATATSSITIKKIDDTTNTVTVDPAGAETIDGSATISLSTPNSGFTLYSDGSQWRGASTILTADDSAKVGGFTPSQSPTANQIPVLNAQGELGIGGVRALFAPTNTVQMGAATTYAVISANSSSHFAHNAYLNAAGQWLRNSIGAAHMFEISNGGIAYYSTASGAADSVITWTGPTIATAMDADLLDGQQGAYYQPASDNRLKKDITTLPEGLAIINALRPVRFKWNAKADELNTSRNTKGVGEIGLIAQEVKAVLPEAVINWLEDDETGKKYMTLSDRTITAVLIKAVQELTARITALEAL